MVQPGDDHDVALDHGRHRVLRVLGRERDLPEEPPGVGCHPDDATVWIPAGQKHWHGASPTTGMSHIAIVEMLDGQNTDWMEKVTDEQYGAPVRPRHTDAGP